MKRTLIYAVPLLFIGAIVWAVLAQMGIPKNDD